MQLEKTLYTKEIEGQINGAYSYISKQSYKKLEQ